MKNFADVLEKFNSFLEQSMWFRSFKFVLGFYMIIIVIIIIFATYRLVKKYSYMKVLLGGQEVPVIKAGKFQSRWNEVEKLSQSQDEDSWKAAILVSAEMLNEVFEIVGYKGETLGEKLSSINKDQLSNLEQIKKANEVKNNIVKNEKFQITKEDALEIIKIFKEALQSFEAVS